MDCEMLVDTELTCRHVGEALDVHRHTALRWLRAGIIPGGYTKRPGGYWFIRESKLREFLDATDKPHVRLDNLLARLNP